MKTVIKANVPKGISGKSYKAPAVSPGLIDKLIELPSNPKGYTPPKGQVHAKK